PSRFARTLDSPQSLTVLLGSKRADAVEAKAKDDPILLSDADVKCVVLDSQRAAIVSVSESIERTDQWRLFGTAMIFEVKEHRGAGVKAMVAVAQKHA